MYKNIGKDEILVMTFLAVTAIAYRLLHKYAVISDKVMLIIFMLSVAYLFFNRTVKLIIDAVKMKGCCYETHCTIEDIVRVQMGRGSYNMFIVCYTDERNEEHTKQIHGAFSLKKWKIGDRIRIRVSESDPEKIIIVHSDAALAVFMSVIGIIGEIIMITLYIKFIR